MKKKKKIFQFLIFKYVTAHGHYLAADSNMSDLLTSMQISTVKHKHMQSVPSFGKTQIWSDKAI